MRLALIGTLAYEFSGVLPVLADTTFGGGAGTYALLTSAMGAGAVLGGLVVAGRARTGIGPLAVAALGFGGAMALVALAPTLPLAVGALLVVRAASVTFLATGNPTLQLTSDPRYRGRVMALWAVAFLGARRSARRSSAWCRTRPGPAAASRGERRPASSPRPSGPRPSCAAPARQAAAGS